MKENNPAAASLSTCKICKLYFSDRPSYVTCETCGAGIEPVDRVALAFAVSEKWNRKLMALCVLLLAISFAIAGGVTWFFDGSYFTQRNASSAPIPRGSMFFEVAFALWIALIVAVGLMLKKPPAETDPEGRLHYLGFRKSASQK